MDSVILKNQIGKEEYLNVVMQAFYILQCLNPRVYGQVSELAEPRAGAASRLVAAHCVGLLQ